MNEGSPWPTKQLSPNSETKQNFSKKIKDPSPIVALLYDPNIEFFPKY